MTKLLKSQEISQIDAQQIIDQQQTMIVALKDEILRLQVEVKVLQNSLTNMQDSYTQAQQEVIVKNQKIDTLKQNNESLLQTLQVFQRQFVKRDYKNALTPATWTTKDNSEGPWFMQLLKILKSKVTEPNTDQNQIQQKSYMSQYYGYFFHSEVQDAEQELFREAQSNKKTRVSKIKNFGKKKFFNEKFRYFFWSSIFCNSLKINFKLYEILLDRLDGNRENQLRPTNIIDLDLRRMDFKLDADQTESMKVQTKKCLELFCVYRPDIGYIQGMSYLAWMLLIRLDPYSAFSCFSNMILCDPFIHSLYMFKEDNIKKILRFYEECLEDKRPKLSKHMKKNGVQSELFIIQWAYTFFSRAFSLRISSKIWDLWFSEGFNAFFKGIMAIMEMLEPEILQQTQNDKIIEILRTKTHKLNEDEFSKILAKQKLYEDLRL